MESATTAAPWRSNGCHDRRASRRSLVVAAKKKKQKEYGSGRLQFGLPALETTAEGEAPKLADYLMFGKLMGEKPDEVQRQLQLNSTAVEVDEESLELLSDWESQEMQAYAVFEALMEKETNGDSAASSTLARNKNRAGLAEVLPPPKPKAPPQLTAAQRKLAKNKDRSATMPSLSQLGGMIASRSSPMRFEQLATKPARPSLKLKTKPQRPSMQAAVVDDEDTSFLEDDALWAELSAAAPTYTQFERALRGAAPPQAPGRASAAASTVPIARPAVPTPMRTIKTLATPAQLLPRPVGAAPSGQKKPPILAAPPARRTLPAKPAQTAAPVAAKPPPPLSPRPSLPVQEKAPQQPTAATPAAAPKPAAAPMRPAKPAQAPAKPARASAHQQPPAAAAAAAPTPAAASPAAKAAPAAQAHKQQEATATPAATAEAPKHPAQPAPASASQPPAAAGAVAAAPKLEAPVSRTAGAGPVIQPLLEQQQQQQQQERKQEAASPPKPPSLQALSGAAVAAAAMAMLKNKSLRTSQQQQQQQLLQLAASAEVEAAAEEPQPLEGQPLPAPTGAQPLAEQQEPEQQQQQRRRQQGAEWELQRPRAPASGLKGKLLGRAAWQASREARREQTLQHARERMAEARVVEVRVWQVNAAGVLVEGEHLTGFIPMTQLTTKHGRRVLEEEARLMEQAQQAGGARSEELQDADAGGATQQQQTQQQQQQDTDAGGATQQRQQEQQQRTQLRRKAMEVLLGVTLQACVLMVKEEGSQVVLSERAAAQRQAQARSTSLDVATATLPLLGQVVPATIVAVKEFGCFVEFDIPQQAPQGLAEGGASVRQVQQGGKRDGNLRGVGLVHASQLSWERVERPSDAFEVGQTLPAVISHVDTERGRIFLSFRHATPHPLQETLDTMLGLTQPALAAGQGAAGARAGTVATAGAAGGVGGEGGGGGMWAEPLADLRPALGDMAAALQFCEVLGQVEGVVEARPCVRLQSRASSQALEVYLAKEDKSGEGEAATPQDGIATFRLILRKGLSVQEVAVRARLSRQEVRQLAADAVAELAESEE